MKALRLLKQEDKPVLTVIRQKTTTVYPEGYEGNVTLKLKVPEFGEQLVESKTRFIPFMQCMENVSSFKMLSK